VRLEGTDMSDQIRLEDLERMAEQLPLPDRLKLIAHIRHQLSESGVEEAGICNGETEVDAWLAECDTVAQSIEGDFDSAEDLRKIRQERANRL
jgi:hypothetical protein